MWVFPTLVQKKLNIPYHVWKMLPEVWGCTLKNRTPPHLLHRTDWFCVMKGRVCSDNHKDSRNKDKPVVKIRIECHFAKLKLVDHWQLHACRTWFAGREKWGGTTIASARPIHTAHSRDTCVPSAFVLPSPFPLGLTYRLPFLFPLPPFQQESCCIWLCAILLTLPLKNETLQKLSAPLGKTVHIFLSPPP